MTAAGRRTRDGASAIGDLAARCGRSDLVPIVTPALAVLLLLLPFTASAACPAHATPDAFLAPGAFGVGVRTLTLVDPSRPTPPRGAEPGAPERTLVTEVWYPADQGGGLTPVRDAPVAAGAPFPLVV